MRSGSLALPLERHGPWFPAGAQASFNSMVELDGIRDGVDDG